MQLLGDQINYCLENITSPNTGSGTYIAPRLNDSDSYGSKIKLQLVIYLKIKLASWVNAPFKGVK